MGWAEREIDALPRGTAGRQSTGCLCGGGLAERVYTGWAGVGREEVDDLTSGLKDFLEGSVVVDQVHHMIDGLASASWVCPADRGEIVVAMSKEDHNG